MLLVGRQEGHPPCKSPDPTIPNGTFAGPTQPRVIAKKTGWLKVWSSSSSSNSSTVVLVVVVVLAVVVH